MCDGADYFYSSTEKTSAQRFEIQTEDMGTPIKRWESGLLRLYIAPVSAYLRWYDTYDVYRRQTWTREYARNQKTAIQMVDI